jgi:Zn finger protein HypA/HybF involved in hydrogenase expression
MTWNEMLLETEGYLERYRKALKEIVSFLKLNKDNLRVASNFDHIQEIAQVALDGEPTTADEVNEKRVDYKCENCGSDDIGWDAFAGWDSKSQKYVLSSTYDHCECLECESTDIKEVDLHNKEIQNYGPPYSMANPTGEPVKAHPLAARYTTKGIQDDLEC